MVTNYSEEWLTFTERTLKLNSFLQFCTRVRNEIKELQYLKLHESLFSIHLKSFVCYIDKYKMCSCLNIVSNDNMNFHDSIFRKHLCKLFYHIKKPCSLWKEELKDFVLYTFLNIKLMSLEYDYYQLINEWPASTSLTNCRSLPLFTCIRLIK